ncbi:hypothetical protein Ancab_003142 [Ancistrocladus abbreviatus]
MHSRWDRQPEGDSEIGEGDQTSKRRKTRWASDNPQLKLLGLLQLPDFMKDFVFEYDSVISTKGGSTRSMATRALPSLLDQCYGMLALVLLLVFFHGSEAIAGGTYPTVSAAGGTRYQPNNDKFGRERREARYYGSMGEDARLPGS